jgi:hypothetical protein
MRQLPNQFSLLLSMVFLVSCASAIPPARIGEYVSLEHKTFDDAFSRINQRPLPTGLVVWCRIRQSQVRLRICRTRHLFALGIGYNRGSIVRFLWR